MTKSRIGDQIYLLILFSGLYTILLGIISLFYPAVYIIPLFNLTYPRMVENKSMFSIFTGFFLMLLSMALKNKTKMAWRLTAFWLFVSTFVLFFKGFTVYYIDLLAITFNIFLLIMLFLHRNEYVFPSKIFSRPEVGAALIIIIFTVSYGLGGSLLFGAQFRPEIKDPYTALYFTIETVTTLGFGDIVPVTVVARMFTASLAIFGIASFFGALTILITPIIQERVGEVMNIMEKFETKSFKNHILVCGYSHFILDYLEYMKEQGRLIVIVEKSSEAVEFLKNRGFIVVHDRADDEKLLGSLNLNDTNKIIISSEDDGYNLLIAFSINQQDASGKLKDKIIVLINSSKNYNKFKSFSNHVIDTSTILKKYFLNLES